MQHGYIIPNVAPEDGIFNLPIDPNTASTTLPPTKSSPAQSGTRRVVRDKAKAKKKRKAAKDSRRKNR